MSGVTLTVEFHNTHEPTLTAVEYLWKEKVMMGMYIAQNFKSAVEAVDSLSRRLTLRIIDKYAHVIIVISVCVDLDSDIGCT